MPLSRIELRNPPASPALRPPPQLLRQVPAHAVAEDRDLGEDVDARLERRLLLAMLADAAVTGAYAEHASAVHQNVLPGKAGEEVDPCGFHLAREPPHELV